MLFIVWLLVVTSDEGVLCDTLKRYQVLHAIRLLPSEVPRQVNGVVLQHVACLPVIAFIVWTFPAFLRVLDVLVQNPVVFREVKAHHMDDCLLVQVEHDVVLHDEDLDLLGDVIYSHWVVHENRNNHVADLEVLLQLESQLVQEVDLGQVRVVISLEKGVLDKLALFVAG